MSPEPTLPASLPAEREKAVELLSHHFAYDNLSIDELERRLELTYKAQSVAEVQALTKDLAPMNAAPPSAAPVAPTPTSLALSEPGNRDRMVAIMSESRRRGVWAVPQELRLVALMSNTVLDLRQAVIPGGVVDIQVKSMWAAVKIIVPPNVHVVNRASAFIGAVREVTRTRDSTPAAGATVVRVSGFAFMAELEIIVAGQELLVEGE